MGRPRHVGPYVRFSGSPEEEFTRLKSRVPRFKGVLYQEDTGKWQAQIRDSTGVWHPVGGPVDTCGAGWTIYQAARKPRAEAREKDSQVDALLQLSAACRPLEVETRSLMGSSLDLCTSPWRNWDAYYGGDLYETRREK